MATIRRVTKGRALSRNGGKTLSYRSAAMIRTLFGLQGILKRNAEKYQKELQLFPSNFEECVRLGFPELESYDGRVPTEEETEKLVAEWYASIFGEMGELPQDRVARLAAEFRAHIIKSSLRMAKGKQGACLDGELRHIEATARRKRQYSEAEARRDFPNFELWKVVDRSSRLSVDQRNAFFENPSHSFSSREQRHDFIGLLQGQAGSTTRVYIEQYRSHPHPHTQPRSAQISRIDSRSNTRGKMKGAKPGTKPLPSDQREREPKVTAKYEATASIGPATQ
jgi:hypothetical protein